MISREQFMEYYRSDKYSEELSPDDKVEVFKGSLAGESDITQKLLQDLADDYNSGKIIIVQDMGEDREAAKLFVQKIYHAAGKAKERYRSETGSELLLMMMNDASAPKLFAEMISLLDIRILSFEKEVSSPEYMPDTGWYIVFTGGTYEDYGFMYECTDTYEEVGDRFDGADIRSADDIKDLFEDNGAVICKDDASDLMAFIVGYKAYGLGYDMYDYEGSMLS